MRCFYVVFIWIIASFTPVSASSIPSYWEKSAFAIECRNMSLRDILEDFSRSFGVNLKLKDDVSGSCEGWQRADTAIVFLNKLSNHYRFQWFVYQNTLYVSSTSKSKTSRLDAEPGFKDTLIGLGLFQEKFGWGELPGDDAVIITGPQSYIDIIRRLTYRQTQIKKRETSGNVHIFKLQNAPVEDRRITVREATVTIPGVSSILRRLFGGEPNSRRQGKSIDTENSHDAPSNLAKFKSKDKINIEADVRTNTLLIRAPEKDHSFYQNIIDSLDVPSKLIEIDAIIVDISREDLKEIGANFSFIDKEARGSVDTSTLVGEEQFTPPNANATIFIKDLGLFQANLKALESQGNASVIANTSILTLENQPAVIDLSETVFIQSVGERVVDVRPVTAGTLLNVTPMFVTNNGIEKIKLEVDIEDGKLSSTQESNVPRISRTTINTKAIIDQNRSLVVGGYHVQKSVHERSGIPILKSVPAFGKLFSSKVTKNSNLERLFILTPRVSPTFHNPEDYSSTGNSELVAESIEKIKKRWKTASQSYVEKTTFLLSELASSSIPRGYELGTTKKAPATFKCSQGSTIFQFKGGQKISGHGLTAYVGVVTNVGTEALGVEEQSCHGRGLIAVSVFPKTFLSAGESAEIFISMESARMVPESRPSAL